jgi:hypothetical protein
MKTMHQNTADDQMQEVILFMYQRHLYMLGVEVALRPTPKEAYLSYDAELWVHGKFVAVIELKHINYSSDQVQEWGHLMVKAKQSRKLAKQFMKRSAVTGKPYWNKEVILLNHCTDNVIFATHYRTLTRVWNESKDVPQEFIRKDHGKEIDLEDSGKYIKLEHWERFE